MAIKPDSKGNVTGTKDADKITWVDSKDWKKELTVNAGAGKDLIDFKKSTYKNKLYGEAGNDTIYGGTAADMVRGGAGVDSLYGYNGNDTIYGDDGDDKIYGGNGADSIIGGNGNDYVEGGAGNDRIFGLKGKDTLKGGDGKDFIDGGDDNDSIDGGADDDKLYGNAGNDTIKGGTGANMLFGQKGDDSLVGGNEYDLLDGSDGNDTLIANGGNDIIRAGVGDDLLDGGAGNDSLYGHSGNDIIRGGSGDDYLEGGNGNDSMYGGDGNDLLRGGSDNDYLDGGNGNDTIQAQYGDNTIIGGKGNDLLTGGKGKNRIIFNSGDGMDTVLSGNGTDTLVFSGETATSLTAKYVGNDVLITGANGNNKVTLKNYANGTHSSKWITIGNTTERTDSLLPKNSINAQTSYDDDGHPQFMGTKKPDYIFVSNYDDNTVVNALESDDYIEIMGGNYSSEGNASKTPTIITGAGNDTISLTLAKAILKVDRNSGSDVIIGAYDSYDSSQFSWVGSSGYTNGITIDVKDNSSILIRDGLFGNFILGEKKNNDLVLKLTNGETLTLKDYYTVDHWYTRYKTIVEYDNSSYTNHIESYLQLNNGDAVNITLNKQNNILNKGNSIDKNIITAQENANYIIRAGNGNYNEIAVTADGNHYIEAGSGIRNRIYVMNTTTPYWYEEEFNSEPINGDVTIRTAGWNNDEERHWNFNYFGGFSYYHSIHPNDIQVQTTGKVNITTGKSLNDIGAEGNEVVINSYGADEIWVNGNKNTITSNNTSVIDIGYSDSSKKKHPVNTIYSKGHDNISIYDGKTDIILSKTNGVTDSGKKYIYTSTSDLVTVKGIFNSDMTALRIYKPSSGYNNGNDYVFTHYNDEDVKDANGNGTGHITIYRLNDDGSLSSARVQINGNWTGGDEYHWSQFDLAEYDYENNQAVLDNYLGVVCGDGTPYLAEFSSMKQYVDMEKVDHELDYYSDTLYDICSEVYAMGSDSDDVYRYDFDDCGSVTINEKEASIDSDELIICNNTEEFRLFFNIYNNGNIDDDLIMASYYSGDCEFKKLFSENWSERNSVRCLTLKDYFKDTGGSVENIKAEYYYYGTKYEETLNFNNLVKNGTFGSGYLAENSIIADVVAWLNDDNHKYSSVSSAISSSNLSDDYRTELRELYTNNSCYYGSYWQDFS